MLTIFFHIFDNYFYDMLLTLADNALSNFVMTWGHPPPPYPNICLCTWHIPDMAVWSVFNIAEIFWDIRSSKKSPKIFLRLTLSTNVGINVFSIDGSTYRCPKCGSEIRWSCTGNTGYAYCAKSSIATRVWIKGEEPNLEVCDWEGKCRRRQNGSVEIYYYP